MALTPDRTKLFYNELNVDMPAGLKTSDACDLALYADVAGDKKGVLVVTVICSMNFKNGSGGLVWTADDKTSFMNSMRSLVATTWGEKHRITTTSSVPAVTDIGVMLDVRLSEGMSIFSHSHWDLDVLKVDKWSSSSVHGGGGGFAWNGKGNFDSQDIVSVSKGPANQRAAVHEFGHMLGMRDEYINTETGKVEDNPNWTGDVQSVMNCGEQVRDRHYAMFAQWITDQYKTVARLAKETIEFKVNGSVTLANAKL